MSLFRGGRIRFGMDLTDGLKTQSVDRFKDVDWFNVLASSVLHGGTHHP